jgi:hypothetical protein
LHSAITKKRIFTKINISVEKSKNRADLSPQNYTKLMKNDFLTQVEANTKLREKLANYEQEFVRKPYLIENQNLFLLAVYAKYVFAFISIASAFYFVFTVIFNAIPLEIVAVLLAVLLLVILEVAKFNVLPPLLKTWLKTNKLNRIWLIINILFISLSVYLSVKGIEKYALEQRAVRPTLINEDSLSKQLERKISKAEQTYDQQIHQIRQDKNVFKQQIEWQGKINLYDANTAQRLAAFDKQIETLQQQKNARLNEYLLEKKQQLQKTQINNQTALIKAETITNTNTLYLVGLAFANEILALLCLFYGIFYKYRSLAEIDLLKNYSEHITLSSQDMPILFNYLQTALQGDKTSLKSMKHTPIDVKRAERPQIGFEYGLRKEQTPYQTVEDKSENTATKIYKKKIIVKNELPRKEKYSPEERMEKNLEVVEAIRKYIRDFGKINYTNIAKNTGKDYRTVKEVFQAMQILNLI